MHPQPQNPGREGYQAVGRDDAADDIKGTIHDGQVIADASAATEAEVTMSFKTALRLYPKAVGWSALLSTAIVMEGFDTILLGSFFGFQQFTHRFGVPAGDGTGDYIIPAAWQAALTNASQVGSIVGLIANGILSERFGYRKTLISSLIIMSFFICIQFFATGLVQLLIGAFLLGIPWGVFQTLTVAYASEVCPVALRSYLTTYVNLCWVMGQMVASAVLRVMLTVPNQWAYRIPFALQWFWPIPIIIGTFFAPESPWWLVRKGREADARRSLQRLTSTRHISFDPDQTIAMMIHTNALEKANGAGTSYFDCLLNPVNRRRTEIACVVWMCQHFCGGAFMSYSVIFYQRAGLGEAASFDMTIAQYVLGVVGTVSSWFLMRRCGRRALYLSGLAALCALLLAVGALGLVPQPDAGASWAIGGLILGWTFVYDFTIGPVCYCLVAEISSSRLRAKTVVLARAAYNVTSIINSIITPYMLSQQGWDWGARAGFLWFITCALCLVWCYFRLPEPKGRTYGELDVLFEHRVGAREFATTDVGSLAAVELEPLLLDPGNPPKEAI